VGLEASANLLVAALDLKLVKQLRDAIRTADIAGGKFGPRGSFFEPAATLEPRRSITPEPRIEPRPVIHPTPRFEPRPVIHPTPRLEFLTSTSPASSEPNHCPRTGPILPPWKKPVWEIPMPPPPHIKLVRYRPDIHHKGSLIDLFI